MTEEEKVFDLHKPVRNALRKVGLADSLPVLWEYAENYANGRRISNVRSVISIFTGTDHMRKTTYFAPWEIELITREVLINGNSSPVTPSPKSFADADYLARTVNKLKALENEIYGLYSDQANVLIELHRIAHRQFPWTSYRPNQILFARYHKLYRHPLLEPLFEDKFDLTLKELFTAGIALLGIYISYSSIKRPMSVEIEGLNQATIDKFLEHFSLPAEEMKEQLIGAQQYSANYAYTYNPMRAHPIIEMEIGGIQHYFCPLSVLLVWAMTTGIYYRLVGTEDFAKGFGDSFQAYVGEVLEVTNASGRTVIPEQEYGAKGKMKRTSDWVLDDGKCALFIECKTKRLRQEAKENILSPDELNSNLDDLVSAVVQSYKTIEEYKAGMYPGLPYDTRRQIYPVVVTLEEWYYMGDPATNYVSSKVADELVRLGIGSDALKSSPFTICSIHEFEMLCQTLETTSIAEVMTKWKGPEHLAWSFGPFLSNNYPRTKDNTRCLFPEDFDDMFPESIRKKLSEQEI
jgi:hypothetical protein